MTPEERQVRRFYAEIWNRHDKTVIPDILDENIEFRGSLGVEKRGHDQFIDYLDAVHTALGNYQCLIQELLVDGSRVFARMTFTGIHQADFLGVPATGRRLTWEGAALFHFEKGKITSLWVLGDLKSLEQQLRLA